MIRNKFGSSLIKKTRYFGGGGAEKGLPDYMAEDLNNHKLNQQSINLEKNIESSFLKSLFNNPWNL